MHRRADMMALLLHSATALTADIETLMAANMGLASIELSMVRHDSLQLHHRVSSIPYCTRQANVAYPEEEAEEEEAVVEQKEVVTIAP
jgi:hypothetical protein